MIWTKAKLGEVCTIEKGTTGIQKAIPGKYPLVVTGEERKSHSEFQFDGDAVIIPLVSGTGHGHASIKRLHFQTGKFALGSILCAVIPKNKNQLSAEYLYRFLDLNKENELVARMKGMANVTLPVREIAEVEIPLPPLEEQFSFVKRYGHLETQSSLLSSELTGQQDLVKQLRQAFLREAMQGKLVKQDKTEGHARDLLQQIRTEKARSGKREKELPPIKPEEIPFEIPENWAWCRLGQMGVCQTGTTPSTTVRDYFGNDIPFIKPADITLKGLITDNEGLSYKGLKEGVLVPANSLMMVCIGGSIGKSYYTNREVSCNQQINVITPLGGVAASFLQLFLQSDYFQKAIWAKASGGTTPIVNRSKWESILIPIPPIVVQILLMRKLEQLMQLCDELQDNIEQSEQQNEMLLQQVLREALKPKEGEVHEQEALAYNNEGIPVISSQTKKKNSASQGQLF
jgi:type I restriction enzyme S subunit